jgi:hypothetical protein
VFPALALLVWRAGRRAWRATGTCTWASTNDRAGLGGRPALMWRRMGARIARAGGHGSTRLEPGTLGNTWRASSDGTHRHLLADAAWAGGHGAPVHSGRSSNCQRAIR